MGASNATPSSLRGEGVFHSLDGRVDGVPGGGPRGAHSALRFRHGPRGRCLLRVPTFAREYGAERRPGSSQQRRIHEAKARVCVQQSRAFVSRSGMCAVLRVHLG